MTNRLATLALIMLATTLPGRAGAEPLKSADQAKPTLEFAFEEIVTLSPSVPVGDTVMGGRDIVPITGGTFSGPEIRGTIVPGGWDWQLLRPDGCKVIKADYMLKTDDGVIINVVNSGFSCPNADGTRQPVRTAPVFEAPRGKYEWLSRSAFIGTLEGTTVNGTHGVKIRFYRVK